MLRQAALMAEESKAKVLLNLVTCECSKHLDVRVLVGDDELLEGGILAALEEYNTEELATVEVPGIDGKVGINLLRLILRPIGNWSEGFLKLTGCTYASHVRSLSRRPAKSMPTASWTPRPARSSLSITSVR